jgi:hypothetical protein
LIEAAGICGILGIGLGERPKDEPARHKEVSVTLHTKKDAGRLGILILREVSNDAALSGLNDLGGVDAPALLVPLPADRQNSACPVRIDLLDDFFQTSDGASRRDHTFETRSQTRELFGGGFGRLPGAAMKLTHA